PRQSPHGEAGVVAIFAHHIHGAKAPTLFGHGKPTRDYVYVSDVVAAMLAAVGKAGTYNIATGVATDVMSIWTGLLEAAGRSRVHAEGSRAAELQAVLADLRPGELLGVHFRVRVRRDAGPREGEPGRRGSAARADGGAGGSPRVDRRAGGR